MSDITQIFATVPSYWAISSGYYYAIENFDDFMESIYGLINKTGVKLTNREKADIADRMFKNDPRDHRT